MATRRLSPADWRPTPDQRARRFSKGKGGACAQRRAHLLARSHCFHEPGQISPGCPCARRHPHRLLGRQRCVAADGTCVFTQGDLVSSWRQGEGSGESEARRYDCSAARRRESVERGCDDERFEAALPLAALQRRLPSAVGRAAAKPHRERCEVKGRCGVRRFELTERLLALPPGTGGTGGPCMCQDRCCETLAQNRRR